MSKAAAKLEKVRAERDRLFAAGSFYEALQLYKTLYSRACVKKSWSEAQEIVIEGATALLDQGQRNAGGELALLLVELLTKSKQTCEADSEALKAIMILASAFPSEGNQEAKVAFLKAAIKWSTPAGSAGGCPDLHLTLARVYKSEPDHPSAHQHYLRSGGATPLIHLSEPSGTVSAAYYKGVEYVETCDNVVSWCESGGLPSELDLFFLRTVLQFLCIEDLAGANATVKYVKSNQKSIAEEPAVHLADFLCQVCQRSKEAVALFDVLQLKYALVLSRDPALDSYLAKIGEVFFGREAPKGLMESMLSGFGASPAPSATAQKKTADSSSTPAPTASISDMLD